MGAGIPLVISGSWTDPQLQLAIGGTLTGDLRDPAAMAQIVSQLSNDPEQLLRLREQFGVGDSPLDAVGSLLGKGESGEPSAVAQEVQEEIEEVKEEIDKAKESIDQLKEGLGSLFDR